MDAVKMECYPKVVPAKAVTTLHFRFNQFERWGGVPEAKMQPMEHYGVSHAPEYLSHHEDRYPWMPLTEVEEGHYVGDFPFAGEQRYSVKVRWGDRVCYAGFAYAVEPDLAALRPYKGDMHLHTSRSDGNHPPFETAIAYRKAGFDFIAITDHGRYAPSVEAQAEFAALTRLFYVMPGEEVHNRGGGYFHIVHLNGAHSVNAVLEQQPEYIRQQVEAILAEREDLAALPDPWAAAFRIAVAGECHRAGGLAVLTHPFWESGGEYNMQTEEFLRHCRRGDFDVMEVLCGCDDVGNGNNLQELLWQELRAEGVRMPVIGTSDAHVIVVCSGYDHFNEQFTLIFATGYDNLADAIMDHRSVAVERLNDRRFRCIGDYRYAKYARFLMGEYYPGYSALAALHGEALAQRDAVAIAAAEREIEAYNGAFYGI